MFAIRISNPSTSLLFVERKRKESAFGALIGWREITNQSERERARVSVLLNVNQTRTKPSDLTQVRFIIKYYLLFRLYYRVYQSCYYNC